MNKRRYQILIILALTAVLVFAASAGASAVSYDLAMKIDGEPVLFDDNWGAPYISGGRTMVPVRAAMESFGCNVEWNGSERSVLITKEGSETAVKLFINSNTVLLNGEETYTDTAPVIVNNRTYLPIRFVLEAFGAGVVWNGPDRTIYVYSEGLYHQVTYKWSYPWKSWRASNYEITLTLDNELYTRYISEVRDDIYDDEEYMRYVNDERDDAEITRIVGMFEEYGTEHDMDDDSLVRMVVSFVQSFEYIDDDVWTGIEDSEYPKYPYETLYDHCGDCEDTAALLIAMLRELGYGSCLLAFEDHMAVGILGEEDLDGYYFEDEGDRYYYVETTAKGWEIGEMPDEYIEAEAYLLF